jgi:hypothetical protein
MNWAFQLGERVLTEVLLAAGHVGLTMTGKYLKPAGTAQILSAGTAAFALERERPPCCKWEATQDTKTQTATLVCYSS